MLEEEQINKNRDKFVGLLRSIKIDGADIEGLIRFLESTDFFIAPATTKYHNAFAGGLCGHSLNVYETLVRLVDTFSKEITNPDFEKLNQELEVVSSSVAVLESDLERLKAEKENSNTSPEDIEELSVRIKEAEDTLLNLLKSKIDVVIELRTVAPTIKVKKYSDDTLKIVGLLHDLSRINFYELYKRNVKDENGKWQEELNYKVRDAEDRDIAGSKGFNTFIILSQYIPLSKEELIAIYNQSAGMDKQESTEDIHAILGKYNLTTYLHLADMLCSYCLDDRETDKIVVQPVSETLDKPTEKQLAFIKANTEIDINIVKTKKHASKIISDYIKENEGTNTWALEKGY